MSSRLVAKVKQTRHNWWEQFKVFCSLKGYKYYKPPPELKYRYPAPGSCMPTEEDRSNYFKNDWKTPFRDSEYNVRALDKPFESNPIIPEGKDDLRFLPQFKLDNTNHFD